VHPGVALVNQMSSRENKCAGSIPRDNPIAAVKRKVEVAAGKAYRRILLAQRPNIGRIILKVKHCEKKLHDSR